MRPAEGGINRFAPVLLFSLLLHLGALFGAGRFTQGHQRSADAVAGSVVAYLELGAVQGKSNLPVQRQRSGEPGSFPPTAGASPSARLPLSAPLPHGAAATQSAAAPAAVPAPAVSAAVAASAARSISAPSKEMAGREVAGNPGGAAARDVGTLGPGPGTIRAAGAGSAPAARPAEGEGGASREQRGNYQAQLKGLIEAHKEYPPAARRTGREGSCRRRFLLRRDGSLERIESVTSCGHPFLDAAATRAINAVGTFPPLPQGFSPSEPFEVTLTFALGKR